MNSVEMRYPPQALLADYGRAAAGAVLCGLPLLTLEINRWLSFVLAVGCVLFVSFFLRTAIRHRTSYLLEPDRLRVAGPVGGQVEWARLDRLKLSYYSTRRDRTAGWMQLAIGSAGGRIVKVDSSLEGFYDVAEQAAQAAEAAGLQLGSTTLVNLRSMGISVAGQEETA